MKILAFGASNHSASINATLARYASDRFKAHHNSTAQTDFLDLNDFEMPIYSIDRESADGIPQLAHDFLARINAADALIISFPEYNGSYTSAWKNIFDWMSRIGGKVYQNKPTVALAASPGPRAGAGILATVIGAAPHFGMDLVGSLGIGTWGEAYNYETEELTREDDVTALDEILAKLSISLS